MSGKDLVKLMRRYRVRIRDLAERIGTTQKRVRALRTMGIHDRNTRRDWIQAITGVDPGPQ